MKRSISAFDKPDIGVTVQYIVKNDTFGFKLYNESRPELVICVDNFPSPRKYFRSDLPINTFEDLEYNLKQAGIELIRNPKVLVFDAVISEFFSTANCSVSQNVNLFVFCQKEKDLKGAIANIIRKNYKDSRAKEVLVLFGNPDERNFSFEL